MAITLADLFFLALNESTDTLTETPYIYIYIFHIATLPIVSCMFFLLSMSLHKLTVIDMLLKKCGGFFIIVK